MMSRLRLLVVPTCLVLSACSTPASGPSVPIGASGALRAAPEPVSEADPGAWTTATLEAEATGAAPAPQEGGAFSGMTSRHITILLGERMLDDDDWDPVEDQLALGVELDGTDPSTGHGYEVGLTSSYDEDDVGPVDVEGSTFDIYGGYRHTFRPDPAVHPYLSAGLAWIFGEVELDGPGPTPDDDDSSLGAYVRAGIGFDLNERTRLGIDYRHLFLSDVDILGIDDIDFDQLALTLGFAF